MWVEFETHRKLGHIINNRIEKALNIFRKCKFTCEHPLSLPADRNRKLFVSNTKLFVVIFIILLIVIVFKRIYIFCIC